MLKAPLYNCLEKCYQCSNTLYSTRQLKGPSVRGTDKAQHTQGEKGLVASALAFMSAS
jgi:hypothetical protein